MTHEELEEAVERSAAPGPVKVALARLDDAYDGFTEQLVADAPRRAATIAVLAASRSLTQRLFADSRMLGVLGDLDTRPPLDASTAQELVRWRHLEFLRIAARDLTGRDDLGATGAALATLAEDVFGTACVIAGAASRLAVIGMGKLGGRELNYASDVDVVFVGEGDVKAVIDVARTCFRVDADLRPEGRDGPLTRSLESYEAYWERWAQPWEFQALLKARPVAGSTDLGAAFADSATRHLWERPFGADELRSLRDMKARAEGEVARRGLTDREVKLGRGGIRDIEFAVQLLQLVHGRLDPDLRSPNTIDALHELAAAGYVDTGDAASLEGAYRFLREVEHRLQLADEAQVHALPADAEARTRLARVLGYRDRGEARALAQFDDDVRAHRTTARAVHERLYFRPLLEAFAGTGERVMPAEAVGARLSAFGFVDAERTRQALLELTRGLTRSSRLMQQLLPLLLDWLSQSPDPDLGLVGLRNIVTGSHRSGRLVDLFRDNPVAARRLCVLLGTSGMLHRTLARQVDAIEDLGGDAGSITRDKPSLASRAAKQMGWRGASEDQLVGLRRFKEVEELRIAAADILGMSSVEETASSLTALAETSLDVALELVAAPVPMAVIGMGRFGGAELSYASDLDVLLVHRAETASDAAAAEEAAETLMRLVSGATPAARIYLLDTDLRPEGKQGLLARSLDGYRTYYERWARTWERQALVRARPVAGDRELAEQFMALVEGFVWGPVSDEEVKEIRRMKARVERERIAPGDDPQFHLKLGRGSLSDVEWTVQLLQLRHGLRAPGTIDALDRLETAGLLAPDHAEVLRASYRFCERTRNRWYLVRGAPGDSLPARADQLAKLARSLGTTSSALRDDYRRVTRRARAVVEDLFYAARPPT